ncbi:conserved hypothetical protein [methanotrophic bacterial endosymbiont of Bathymodiolus sp.]|nr:conserved hypothetical protein [methanotrophic bacterial endosymbiont of Bathymodiolus sp.]
MLTLLGSLLGFISSAFPDLLKIWQDKQDRKHELQILDRQMEQMRLGHNQRLEEISVNADINESLALLKYDSQPSGIKWVDGLRSSVRPVLTYAFFLLFTAIKICALYVLGFRSRLRFRNCLATNLGPRNTSTVRCGDELLVWSASLG